MSLTVPLTEQVSSTGIRLYNNDYSSKLVKIPSGSAPIIDLSLGDTFYLLANQNFSLQVQGPIGGIGGQTITVYIQQDTIGNRLITFPAGTDHPSGVIPTLSTIPNTVDILKLRFLNSGTGRFEESLYKGFHGATFYRPATFTTDANVTWTNTANTIDNVNPPQYPLINMDTTTFGFAQSSSGVDVSTAGYIAGWASTVVSPANCYVCLAAAPTTIGSTAISATVSIDGGTSFPLNLATWSTSSSTISFYQSPALTGLSSSNITNVKVSIPAGRHTLTEKISVYDIYIAQIYP